MNIREFTLNLQKLYGEMSSAFSEYQKNTGMDCLSGCGRCCLNPEVEASAYEMVPLAYKIFKEGKLEKWLLKLEETNQNFCILLEVSGSEGQGRCSSYNERPSVCRMFGVAGYFNKDHQKTLSICKYIKDAHQELVTQITPSDATPVIAEWMVKLATLEPNLIQDKKSINEAIKEALQKVALYAQYHSLD